MENVISTANFLKERLEEIQLNNKSYSLRAFAAKIGISPGGLVHIFSGKKKLSLDRAHEIAHALKLSKEQKKIFFLIVEFDQSKKSQRKAEILDKLKRLDNKNTSCYFNFSVDQFKLISHWYGLAILECISCYGHKFTIAMLAKHFGLTTNDVSLTLDRLISLELIEKDNNGCWSLVKDRVLVTSNIDNDALKNYYRSVNEKSLKSYQEQSTKFRVSGSEVFTLDLDQLDDLKKITDEYLTRLSDLAKEGKYKNHTYQALVNIFKISELKENA